MMMVVFVCTMPALRANAFDWKITARHEEHFTMLVDFTLSTL